MVREDGNEDVDSTNDDVVPDHDADDTAARETDTNSTSADSSSDSESPDDSPDTADGHPDATGDTANASGGTPEDATTAGTEAYLLVAADHDRQYLRRPGDRLETDLGVVEVPRDVRPGDRLETHLGDVFSVRELRGPDLFDHLERTGAPMLPRDIGLLMGLTGAAAGDRALDAGTGTGILAVYLGRAGVDVITYERDPEFAAVARENVVRAGVDENVTVRTGDLFDDLPSLTDGPPFDLLTLDTGDAPAAMRRAPALLVEGGFAVAYCPFVERAREVEERAREAGLRVETRETIQREMDFDERGSRPTTAGVGHTGYLVVARHLPARG